VNTLIADKTNYGNKRSLEDIKYLVIHFTANDGDTDSGNANYFHNNKNLKSSAHYFVDEDSITQSVYDDYIAYHCGANKYKDTKCRNFNSIGIEMCSDKTNGRYIITEPTVSNTIELVCNLMGKYNIPLECIVRHYDVTGKNCPAQFVEDESKWIDFKLKLEGEDVIKRYNCINELPEWAKPTITKLYQAKVLTGDGTEKLDLSEDMIRMFVVNDRFGLYTKK